MLPPAQDVHDSVLSFALRQGERLLKATAEAATNATTTSTVHSNGTVDIGGPAAASVATDDDSLYVVNSTGADNASIDHAFFVGETSFETVLNALLGVAFLITAACAAHRMSWSRNSGGAETTVVTAFYSLILTTSVLRAVWFLIPALTWLPSYTPIAVKARDPDQPWFLAMVSEIILTCGSLALFSIFILILVYWADILKKYFHPASRRSIPMMTFVTLVSILVTLEVLNIVCFLLRLYSTEGMILVNSLLLAFVSIVCVCEITIFSHRFRTVLKTLGAINQVSTDAQVQRIVWITVTGNLFFFTRAFLETLLCAWMLLFYKRHGSVARVFSHASWDTYVAVKFWSEVTILGLMLYILQSRFAANATGGGGGGGAGPRPAGYVSVPNADIKV